MNRFQVLTDVLTSAVIKFLNETHDKLPPEEEDSLDDLIENQIEANEGEYTDVDREDLTNYYREVYVAYKLKHAEDEDEDVMGDFEEFIRNNSVEDFFNKNIKVE